MAKLVSTTGEQTKHKVRSLRQDGMKQLKHDSKHQSADEIKKLEKSVSLNMTKNTISFSLIYCVNRYKI
jgi:ribosome recycling factor